MVTSMSIALITIVSGACEHTVSAQSRSFTPLHSISYPIRTLFYTSSLSLSLCLCVPQFSLHYLSNQSHMFLSAHVHSCVFTSAWICVHTCNVGDIYPIVNWVGWSIVQKVSVRNSNAIRSICESAGWLWEDGIYFLWSMRGWNGEINGGRESEWVSEWVIVCDKEGERGGERERCRMSDRSSRQVCVWVVVLRFESGICWMCCVST